MHAEAERRLKGHEAGRFRCNQTGRYPDAVKQGKRPHFFTQGNVGAFAAETCKPVSAENFGSREFQKLQSEVCGENKSYVYGYKRGDPPNQAKGSAVKPHCRKLAGGPSQRGSEAPKPAAKPKPAASSRSETAKPRGFRKLTPENFESKCGLNNSFSPLT